MAGGNRTSDHGTMAERVARSHTAPMRPRETGPTVVERREQATYPPSEPRHVLVLTDAGRQPGLLVEWRKPLELPWEGRVIHTRLVDGRWVQVDEWLPGGAIEPV